MTKTLRVLIIASLLGATVEASTLHLAIQNNYRGIDNKAKIQVISNYNKKRAELSKKNNRLIGSKDYDDIRQLICIRKEIKRIDEIIEMLKEA